MASYEFEPASKDHPFHRVVAHTSGAKFVGHLSWHPDTGKIIIVNVGDEWQRQGIGTGMFNHANSLNGVVHPTHSNVLTKDGKAWKKSLETGKNA